VNIVEPKRYMKIITIYVALRSASLHALQFFFAILNNKYTMVDYEW
jgi:hypothetical protein